jgi:hypothetical protein
VTQNEICFFEISRADDSNNNFVEELLLLLKLYYIINMVENGHAQMHTYLGRVLH